MDFKIQIREILFLNIWLIRRIFKRDLCVNKKWKELIQTEFERRILKPEGKVISTQVDFETAQEVAKEDNKIKY